MTTGENSRGRYYRPELDVLRFYAFLLVFLTHTVAGFSHPRLTAEFPRVAPILIRFANSGEFGLNIFFVLSAFLLCELLFREKRASGSVLVGQFYLRRIARIWPLYYLALALGAIYTILPGSETGISRQLGLYAVFMAPLSVAHFGWLTNPIVPLWSISVEERFYLFVPWLLKLFDRQMLCAISAGLILAANLRLFYLGSISASGDSIWVDSLVQSQNFAAGILISLVLKGRLPRFPIWTRLFLFIASSICFYSPTLGFHEGIRGEIYANSWSLVALYLLITFGASLALISFLGLPSRLFPRWAVYLGRISYGLYAFHLFLWDLAFRFLPDPGLPAILFLFLKILVALALTIAVAALSFRFIEMPFVRFRKRHAVIASQPD